MSDEQTDFNKKFPYSFCEYINIVSLIAVIVFTFLQVISRFITKDGSLAWTEELIRIVFICLVYSGMGRAVKYDMNFAVETNLQLPRPIYLIQQTVVRGGEIAVMLILIYGGLQLIPITMNDRTPVLRLPTSVYYIPLTFGAVGVVFHSFCKLLDAYRKGGS